MSRQLHLGAILAGVGMSQNGWKRPGLPKNASINIGWYKREAQKVEQAKFDLVFIVDSPYITPDSAPHFLNRLEPLTMLSAIAGATSHIGLVATATTSYNEPFNLARAFASLDLISDGRAGWNVVTTGLEGAAGNYGREAHFAHEVRYKRAHEHISVVRALWDSYEDDAFAGSEVFLDKSKQHRLDHKGEFFSVTGPLNISRSRQGQPVIFQAGGSNDGRDLAGQTADAIFASAETYEESLAFSRDIQARARAAGRNERVLVLPGVSIILADTDAEAHAIDNARHAALDLKKSLAQLGRPFNYYDFSKHDLDAPFPELGDLGKNGYRSHAERIKNTARAEGLTLREAALRFTRAHSHFIGSPKTIADQMERWFVDEACDGFNVGVGEAGELDGFIAQVLPLLRQRGLFRTEYEHSTLRENLGLRLPPNRYTVAREAAQATAAE